MIYEYRTVCFVSHEVEQELNKAGAEGWRVAAMLSRTPNEEGWIFFVFLLERAK